MNLINLILITFLLAFYYFFLKKFQILNDDINSSKHKKLVLNLKTKPILLGGLYLVTVFFIFSNYNFFPVKFSIILLFFLGLSSDKNILFNPKARLLFQISILFFVIFLQNLKVDDIRIDQLNLLLSNNYFSLVFTVFCFAVLINGSNFIDGLNGLLLGYTVLVILSLLFQSEINSYILIDNNFIYLFLYALIILFVLNLFGLTFLGDNGSYVLSTIMGIFLLDFFANNQSISPYFIAALLWYPAFENLYSLMRRIKFNQNVSSADNTHLHHYIFKYFVEEKIFKQKNANTFSSLVILIFNIPIFIFANIYSENTKMLVSFIIINMIVYFLTYYFLFKYFKYKK